jgi:hypothetical protein
MSKNEGCKKTGCRIMVEQDETTDTLPQRRALQAFSTKYALDSTEEAAAPYCYSKHGGTS